MVHDFRSEKSDSIEGRGIARGRWSLFVDTELERIVDNADPGEIASFTDLGDLDDDVREALAAWATERSELIGFWVSWHMAGGFLQLESGGWHRATIFRKVRRFRTVFGQHPDDYVFPGIKLNLRHAWTAEVRRHLGPSEEP